MHPGNGQDVTAPACQLTRALGSSSNKSRPSRAMRPASHNGARLSTTKSTPAGRSTSHDWGGLSAHHAATSRSLSGRALSPVARLPWTKANRAPAWRNALAVSASSGTVVMASLCRMHGRSWRTSTTRALVAVTALRARSTDVLCAGSKPLPQTQPKTASHGFRAGAMAANPKSNSGSCAA